MSLIEPKPSPRPWFALWRRESGQFAQLPLLARALFGEILKLTDDDGVIDIGDRDPADAVAWALGADRADRRALKRYLPMLLADGCLVHEGTSLRAPSFGRWQPQHKAPKSPPKGPRSDRQPTTNEHERDANDPRTDHDAVTTVPRPCHETRPNPPKPLGADRQSRVEKSREELKEPPNPPSGPEPPSRGKPRSDVLAVFEHWRGKLGKSQASRLDPKRRKRIEWALATYGLDDVLRCIDGYAGSAWHRGDNDRGRPYDDLTLWLRDAEHVERGLAMAEQGPRLVGRQPPSTGFGDEETRRSQELFDAIVGPREAANG